MITSAIHIGIYTIAFFLIGMYKPQWPLFFIKQPNRITILLITMLSLMGSITLYGEGLRQQKINSESISKQADTPAPNK